MEITDIKQANGPETIWGLYEDISQNREQIEAKAKLFNCRAEFASVNVLQLDLDTPEAETRFSEAWPWFQSQLAVYAPEPPVYSNSKSGHCHVMITLGVALSAPERILCQALLGSDLKRELLNFTRYKLNGEDLTCLFRPNPKQLEGETLTGKLLLPETAIS